MPREYAGVLNGSGLRVAIAAARFNHAIVDLLVAGAVDALRRAGVADDAISIARVPGSFELPAVCRRLAASGQHDAVIAIGCIIKGETDHYDHVAGQTAAGLAAVAREADVPVIFGVLTCATVEQAQNRAGLKAGNKGAEAALAAIETANLLRALPGAGKAAKQKGAGA